MKITNIKEKSFVFDGHFVDLVAVEHHLNTTSMNAHDRGELLYHVRTSIPRRLERLNTPNLERAAEIMHVVSIERMLTLLKDRANYSVF